MSDLLKLSTALPGDQEINGLDALAAGLVQEPSGMICVVAIFDVKDVRYDATARAEAAEQAIQLVRELHTPEVAYDSEHHDCEPSECDRAGEGKPYERCAHCSGFAWEQLWPCTTIRALDGGEQHG